jgi:hypothetical protein
VSGSRHARGHGRTPARGWRRGGRGVRSQRAALVTMLLLSHAWLARRNASFNSFLF